MTLRSRRTRSGGPEAMRVPWSRTMARSARSAATSIRRSTRTMVNPSRRRLAINSTSARHLLAGDPVEWLVEQEQSRPACERARDFEPFLHLDRQEARRPVGVSAETDAVEKRQGLPFYRLAAPDAQEGGQDPEAVTAERHRHVVNRAEALERPDGLEYVRDAGSGYEMGRNARDLAAVEDDAPAVGRDEARQAVTARALARAARAEEAEDLSLFRGERDRVERRAAPEALREPDDLEDAHQGGGCRRRRQREAGYRSQKPAAGSICWTTSIQTPAGSNSPNRRCPKGSSRSA